MLGKWPARTRFSHFPPCPPVLPPNAGQEYSAYCLLLSLSRRPTTQTAPSQPFPVAGMGTCGCVCTYTVFSSISASSQSASFRSAPQGKGNKRTPGALGGRLTPVCPNQVATDEGGKFETRRWIEDDRLVIVRCRSPPPHSPLTASRRLCSSPALVLSSGQLDGISSRSSRSPLGGCRSLGRRASRESDPGVQVGRQRPDLGRCAAAPPFPVRGGHISHRGNDPSFALPSCLVPGHPASLS